MEKKLVLGIGFLFFLTFIYGSPLPLLNEQDIPRSRDDAINGLVEMMDNTKISYENSNFGALLDNFIFESDRYPGTIKISFDWILFDSEYNQENHAAFEEIRRDPYNIWLKDETRIYVSKEVFYKKLEAKSVTIKLIIMEILKHMESNLNVFRNGKRDLDILGIEWISRTECNIGLRMSQIKMKYKNGRWKIASVLICGGSGC